MRDMEAAGATKNQPNANYQIEELLMKSLRKMGSLAASALTIVGLAALPAHAIGGDEIQSKCGAVKGVWLPNTPDSSDEGISVQTCILTRGLSFKIVSTLTNTNSAGNGVGTLYVHQSNYLNNVVTGWCSAEYVGDYDETKCSTDWQLVRPGSMTAKDHVDIWYHGSRHYTTDTNPVTIQVG
ncbi:hypothetical protein GTY86_34530 [Streptomyces sp. SID5770]|uniref:hypothetical protein n=1 Tax=Streptomyces sp. SID5770 TaxID=2690308 RepID=UPI00136C5BD0|nr:hypothetical protein [Streptomyces sp. SID5770]MZE56298.1 hypothetical protein [Streptomyces sp. SID5770]